MTEPHTGDLQLAREHLEQLLAAASAIADGDELFARLDERDAALRALDALGVTRGALARCARLPIGQVRTIVGATRTAGVGGRPWLTARLLEHAADSPHPPPPSPRAPA